MSVQTVNESKTILIAEIFETIQGEGKWVGTPAFFIRTGMCNLTCSWCDTPYTWKEGETTYTKQTHEEVFQRVEKSPIQHIVVTGGEPMLHQEFILALRKRNPHRFIEVETNGTIPNTLPPGTVNQFNISPKLSNSGNSWYKLNLRVDSCIFKFVVQSPDDVIEIESFIKQNELDHTKIFLMPEGTTRDILLSRAKWLIPLCREKKFHYSPRLHIMKNIR